MLIIIDYNKKYIINKHPINKYLLFNLTKAHIWYKKKKKKILRLSMPIFRNINKCRKI